MEVSGQHAPAALPGVKAAGTHRTGEEPVWTQRQRQKNIPSLPLLGIEPQSSSP